MIDWLRARGCLTRFRRWKRVKEHESEQGFNDTAGTAGTLLYLLVKYREFLLLGTMFLFCSFDLTITTTFPTLHSG